MLELESEESDETEYNLLNKDDPLLPDKQYLVTMIYNNFVKYNKPLVTTFEFYRMGRKLGQGAFGKVVLA